VSAIPFWLLEVQPSRLTCHCCASAPAHGATIVIIRLLYPPSARSRHFYGRQPERFPQRKWGKTNGSIFRKPCGFALATSLVANAVPFPEAQDIVFSTIDLHTYILHDCTNTVFAGRWCSACAFRNCAGRSDADRDMDNQVAEGGHWTRGYSPSLMVIEVLGEKPDIPFKRYNEKTSLTYVYAGVLRSGE